MKQTMTLAEIQLQVEELARKLLRDSGYTILPDIPGEKSGYNPDPGEKGLVVDMRVVGYSARYDGWDYELDKEDWKQILSISWRQEDKLLLEYMMQQGNVRVCTPDIEAAIGIGLSHGRNYRSSPANYINKEFARQRLQYHIGMVHVNGGSGFRYPTMIQMFKRPMEIDYLGE